MAICDTTKVSQVAKSVWEGRVRKDVSEETLGPYDKSEKRLYTKERKNILNVERRKRRSKRICREAVEKRVH